MPPSLDGSLKSAVPLPGVAAAGERTAAYVIAGSRAKLTRHRLGARNNAEAWVSAGLAAREPVVIYPPAALGEGQRVAVRSVAVPP